MRAYRRGDDEPHRLRGGRAFLVGGQQMQWPWSWILTHFGLVWTHLIIQIQISHFTYPLGSFLNTVSRPPLPSPSSLA